MTRHTLVRFRDRLDRTGVWISGLCALHCVLTVVLVSLLGVGGQFLLNPVIHEFGLVLALVIGAISLGYGVMRHGRLGPIAVGASGLVLMAIAIGTHHGVGEAVLTVTGVALVASAHIWNLHRAA
jgi:CHASE2 domain-containing sensor protein